MAQPGRTLSCRSSLSFGIYSESKKMLDMQKIRSQNRRFSILVAVSIFTLVVVLVSLIVYDVINSSKMLKHSNNKTFIDIEVPEHLEKITASKQTDIRNETMQDVVLVPEDISEIADRRMDEHPNHRYEETESKDEIIERMMKDIYTENGWSPRPFEIHPEVKNKATSLNNIQDIIRQVEMNDQEPAKSTDDKVYQYQGLSKPIRFKGVYVQPKMISNGLQDNDEMGENQEIDPKNNYLQQINQFFGHNSNDNQPTDFNFRQQSNNYNSGYQPNFSASKLYTHAIHHPYDGNQPPKELRKTWTKRNQEVFKKPKKQPITVMLDIYPMTKMEDEIMVEKPKKEIIYIPFKPGEPIYEPLPSPTRNMGISIMPPNQAGRLVGPKRNRMIMKLNLFPKRREMNQKREMMYNPGYDTRIGEVIYPNQKAERRTFGLFSKLKKKKSDCNKVIGHNPRGKPISAKWKDKNGDWVHAKYVALKQWDDWDRKHRG